MLLFLFDFSPNMIRQFLILLNEIEAFMNALAKTNDNHIEIL